MEHYFESLFEYIEQIITMPEEDKQICRESFECLYVPKNTIIEPAGKVPKYQYFIASGYMRNFILDDDGEEQTIDLNHCNRFFSAFDYLLNQTISNENLHCITDCELLRIDVETMQQNAEKSITQKDYTLKLYQTILEENKQRMMNIASLTGEQLYRKLMFEKPNIIKFVPQKYIASYLGMKAESLSRIRKDLIS